ncbi:unnamed protein product [Amoebophrya sp. A25]|nr:unnamed protein product [Amoebophrya sp. A25]|eukprot:GSA25T00012673001.1
MEAMERGEAQELPKTIRAKREAGQSAWQRFLAMIPNVSVSRDSMADVNEKIEFGESPAEGVACPHCHAQDFVTFTEHEATCATYGIACLIVLFFGWLSFCIVGLCWPVLKTVVHRCPHCHNELARKSRIRCPRVSREIFTVQVGNCAVVISRKYALLFLVVVGLVGFFTWRRNHHGVHLLLDAPLKDSKSLAGTKEGTWEEYLKNCGNKKTLGNPLRTRRKYDETYAGNMIEWEGRVNKVTEGFQLLIWDAPGLIRLTMNPAERNRDGIDLTLLFNENLNDAVSELEVGDEISFKATLLGLGTRGSSHVAQIWEVLEHRRGNEIIPIKPPPASVKAGEEALPRTEDILAGDAAAREGPQGGKGNQEN